MVLVVYIKESRRCVGTITVRTNLPILNHLFATHSERKVSESIIRMIEAKHPRRKK